MDESKAIEEGKSTKVTTVETTAPVVTTTTTTKNTKTKTKKIKRTRIITKIRKRIVNGVVVEEIPERIEVAIPDEVTEEKEQNVNVDTKVEGGETSKKKIIEETNKEEETVEKVEEEAAEEVKIDHVEEEKEAEKTQEKETQEEIMIVDQKVEDEAEEEAQEEQKVEVVDNANEKDTKVVTIVKKIMVEDDSLQNKKKKQRKPKKKQAAKFTPPKKDKIDVNTPSKKVRKQEIRYAKEKFNDYRALLDQKYNKKKKSGKKNKKPKWKSPNESSKMKRSKSRKKRKGSKVKITGEEPQLSVFNVSLKPGSDTKEENQGKLETGVKDTLKETGQGDGQDQYGFQKKYYEMLDKQDEKPKKKKKGRVRISDVEYTTGGSKKSRGSRSLKKRPKSILKNKSPSKAKRPRYEGKAIMSQQNDRNWKNYYSELNKKYQFNPGNDKPGLTPKRGSELRGSVSPRKIRYVKRGY